MTFPARLTALRPRMSAAPGTISVYCRRLAGPAAFAVAAGAPHYAASTMKVAVLAALFRADHAGDLDVDAEITIHNDFRSARADGGRFGLRQEYDQDDEVWERLGTAAPLRWLATHMIVKSGNLATNLVLERVGFDRVTAVWPLVGATGSVVGRGIEDAAAREAGIQNIVTAADLAALLSAIARGADPAEGSTLADSVTCQQMLDILLAQEHREDLAAGLPAGTRIAHKNGWVDGIRHGAGVVFPEDAPPYAIAVCTSTEWADSEDGDDEACRLIAEISAAAWADRHSLGSVGQ